MLKSLNDLDLSLFLYMNSFHVSWMDSAMIFLSSQLIWIPMIVFFVYRGYSFFPKKTFWVFLLFLFLALIATDVTSSYVMKNLVHRFRPCRLPEIKALIYNFGQKCGGKFGFVSSHAANSSVLIFFSLRVLRLKGWANLLWLLPLSVSLSRIYLGVHYPGDILGGIIVGLIWGYVLSYLFGKVDVKERGETSSSS